MKPIIPDAALSQHIAVLGKTGSGKSSMMRGLVERLLDDGKPICIVDPKGDWWGLKSSASGKDAGYPVVIFGGDHADVPITAHAGANIAELVATGNRPCIIDLGGWMVSDRTRFFIDFAATLFRHTRGTRWLVLDECHNFCPQGKVLDVDAGKMLHWANRLASEGRGKGLQIIAASQRPQKVHKDFLTSCETLVAMRVIHPLDRNAIKDWIDGCPDAEKGKEVLQSLASMPRGTGWVWSPEIGFGPQRIAFPMFKTYDSFKAPTGDETPLTGWAAVDLDEVKIKLAAVVKRAAEDDPKALRARIAELESASRELAIDVEGLERERRRGKIEGYGEAIAALLPMVDRMQTLRTALDEQLGDLIEDLGKWRARHESAPEPATIGQLDATRSVDKSARLAGNTPTRNIPAGSGTNGALPRAERLVLTALAQYPDGRTKTQVAILTGYAVGGGGFNNAISALRTNGYLEGSATRLAITRAGIAALGPFERLPRGRALLDHWLRQLGKAERKTLETLAEVYPRTLSKAQLANRSGYEPGGGGFNNALSRLRTLELISGRAELRASEALFD